MHYHFAKLFPNKFTANTRLVYRTIDVRSCFGQGASMSFTLMSCPLASKSVWSKKEYAASIFNWSRL